MPAAERAAPLSATEAAALFANLSDLPTLVLAISGGPDSTALLLLAARWRKAQKRGPKLVAVTINHGLRPQARAEANAVHKLSRKIGVAHRTLRWTGRKPKTGLQQAARLARYRLLGDEARKLGARHVLTAHTRDDQAETVLMRFVRGSGLAGLSGMEAVAPLPAVGDGDQWLVRPLLDVPKARLIATLKAAKIPYADDASNRDPQFTRVRLRAVMAALAGEGLTAERLALLARRAARADSALEAAVDAAVSGHAPELIVPKLGVRKPVVSKPVVPKPRGAPIEIEGGAFRNLPAEVALRLLGRAIGQAGDEGPVELGKLEALYAALAAAHGPFRRTLAGALVTLSHENLTVERAPPRRGRASKRP